jgi:acetyl-CoA/propionyl-CoA carboxylase biotin carboxyl carrier protein
LKSTAPEVAPAPGDDEDESEKSERDYKVEVGGKLFDVKVIGEAAGPVAAAGAAAGAKRPQRRERSGGSGPSASSESLPSPLQGTVLKVSVEQGQTVEAGALICVIEAMKMENEITAHRAGQVKELNVSEGASINAGDTIASIVDAE